MTGTDDGAAHRTRTELRSVFTVVRRPLATAASFVAFVLGGLVVPTSAVAHGPCECLVPMLGKPRGKVTIPRTHAYKVIFNPRPGAYGAAMRDVGYHSAYEPDAPSETVVSRPRTNPARGMTFRVPDAPPGVYLVLIFDGTEGGTHATWAYYHVLGRPPKPRDGMTASTGAPALPGADVGPSGAGSSARIALLGIAVAVVAIAGGVFLGRSLGRRGAIRG